ncbi:hypothetical protein [Paraburkholderia dioscoreae]|uniref:Uncharacterized protein n=1 Tax=Paraburkholderia dioscoreae TaxID=2604047 RepID=A0A5Q4ZK96_9BURK|nr:hypothetical protein [Paraburkholderia dioscoreae]VVD32631.1 protein of unknown function [Paraburkholderia dioscoreae]
MAESTNMLADMINPLDEIQGHVRKSKEIPVLVTTFLKAGHLNKPFIQ